MVDPNRKINRLTEQDIEFLDECEEEFANRFTEEDEDFKQHCLKPLAEPPILENWVSNSGQYNNRSSGGSGYRNSYNNRGWNRRGGGDRNFRGNRNDRRPRNDNRRRFNDDSGESDYNKRRFNHQSGGDNDSGPPMKVRRDYGNFVAASKD